MYFLYDVGPYENVDSFSKGFMFACKVKYSKIFLIAAAYQTCKQNCFVFSVNMVVILKCM